MPLFGEVEYEKLFGAGCYINAKAKLYRGIKFRPGIILYMAEDTFIGDNCTILVPKLTMEKGSQICAGTVLTGSEEVILRENAVVGYNCTLLTASDTPKGYCMNDASPKELRCIKRGKIELMKGSFIGSNSVVMPAVTVWADCVVAALSYVNGDVEAIDHHPVIYRSDHEREVRNIEGNK